MVPAVVNLALIILALRWLGKEIYGQYSLVFYFVMLVSTFSVGWIQQSTLRFLSSYKESLHITVVRIQVLSFISSLVGAVIVIVGGLLYFDLKIVDCLILSLVLGLYNYLLVRLTIDQSLFKPVQYAVREGLYNIIMLVSFIILVFYLDRKDYLSIFIAMMTGLICIVFLPRQKGSGSPITLKRSDKYLDAEFSRKMWSFGIMLSVWLSISYLFNIANRFFIKEYAGYEEVGLFSSIYDLIFKISGFVCMPILLAYHPRVTSLWNQGMKKQALGEVKRALLFESLVFVVVAAVFMTCRTLLYDKVLHLNESGLGWMSFILVISAFLWQAALLVHKALEMMLKLKGMISAIVISLIVNIIANIILIPVYGYRAAAMTTLTGIGVYILIAGILTHHYLKRETGYE
jgi:O-antigen/teichoic acid export membrane protein